MSPQASTAIDVEPLSDPLVDALFALPSIMELWPILAIVVLLFGARKLPELARAMGSSVTQFRRGLDSADDDLKSVDGAADEKPD